MWARSRKRKTSQARKPASVKQGSEHAQCGLPEQACVLRERLKPRIKVGVHTGDKGRKFGG